MESIAAQICRIVIWIVVPVINFHVWMYFGQHHKSLEVIAHCNGRHLSAISMPNTPNNCPKPINKRKKERLVEFRPNVALRSEIILAMNCSQSKFRKSVHNNNPVDRNIIEYYDIKMPHIELRNAKEFDVIRGERLATVTYVDRKNTVLVRRHKDEECQVRYAIFVCYS